MAAALEAAEQATAGLATVPGELAAAQWLDAEDATVHQVRPGRWNTIAA